MCNEQHQRVKCFIQSATNQPTDTITYKVYFLPDKPLYHVPHSFIYDLPFSELSAELFLNGTPRANFNIFYENCF